MPPQGMSCRLAPSRSHTSSVMHHTLSLSIIHDHGDGATRFVLPLSPQMPARRNFADRA
jgi:hypothetical protein